jgi:hypothetical protein
MDTKLDGLSERLARVEGKVDARPTASGVVGIVAAVNGASVGLAGLLVVLVRLAG